MNNLEKKKVTRTNIKAAVTSEIRHIKNIKPYVVNKDIVFVLAR